jgi:hypothetical protein
VEFEPGLTAKIYQQGKIEPILKCLTPLQSNDVEGSIAYVYEANSNENGIFVDQFGDGLMETVVLFW